MSISDWSSDVCSSYLVAVVVFADVFLAEIVAVIRRGLAEVERAEAERVERLRTGEVAQWKLLRPQGRDRLVAERRDHVRVLAPLQLRAERVGQREIGRAHV